MSLGVRWGVGVQLVFLLLGVTGRDIRTENFKFWIEGTT